MTQRRFKLIKRGALEDGSVLDDLNDVSSSSATNGQTLIWNGTEWVPGDHGDLAGLAGDDHPQYAALAQNERFTHADGLQVIASAIDSTGLTAANESPSLVNERSYKCIRNGNANFNGLDWGTALTASPAATSTARVLADFRGGGYNGSAFVRQAGAIGVLATETWSGSQNATEVSIYVTLPGTTALLKRYLFQTHFQMLADNCELRIGAGNDLRLSHDGTNSIINNVTGRLDITSAGTITVDKPFRLKGYTVATLPAGTVGDTAYVTDALAPGFGTAVVGGGAVVIPVFYDGTNWIAH